MCLRAPLRTLLFEHLPPVLRLHRRLCQPFLSYRPRGGRPEAKQHGEQTFGAPGRRTCRQGSEWPLALGLLASSAKAGAHGACRDGAFQPGWATGEGPTYTPPSMTPVSCPGGSLATSQTWPSRASLTQGTPASGQLGPPVPFHFQSNFTHSHSETVLTSVS